MYIDGDGWFVGSFKKRPVRLCFIKQFFQTNLFTNKIQITFLNIFYCEIWKVVHATGILKKIRWKFSLKFFNEISQRSNGDARMLLPHERFHSNWTNRTAFQYVHSSAIDVTDERLQCFVVHVFTDTINILVYFLVQPKATCSNFRINWEIYSQNSNFVARNPNKFFGGKSWNRRIWITASKASGITKKICHQKLNSEKLTMKNQTKIHTVLIPAKKAMMHTMIMR